jgi:hypothetical protein
MVAALIENAQDLSLFPGGYGTSIGSALQGGDFGARPDHKLTGPFCDPRAGQFTEGTGKVLNTIPPNDFSYFEMLNDVVQKARGGA